MPRTYTLPEPLATLAKLAGGEARLCEAMGGVPPTTFHRWKKLINDKKPLPRSAVTAINLAQDKLKGAQK